MVSGRETPGGRSLHTLLTRMRDHRDRDAVAEFIDVYGSRIRRRVRSKLSPGMRRIFDSLDVLSSLARRLDRVVARGQLRAMTEGQFMAFVHQVADNALVDQARLVQRLRRTEDPDGDIVRLMHDRLIERDERAAEPRIDTERLAHLLRSIPDEEDRDIACMWMNGRSLAQIGRTVGLSPNAARQRWFQLRRTLREALEGDHADGGIP